MARNRAIIAQNLKAANAWIAEHDEILSWRPPRGGLLSLLHYAQDALGMDSMTLANKLATEYGVMLAPGSAFGYESYLRIGIGQDPAVFQKGLAAAGACFDEMMSKS